MGLLILMGVFALCVVIGVPVAFALGVAAVSAFAFEGLYALAEFFFGFFGKSFAV